MDIFSFYYIFIDKATTVGLGYRWGFFGTQITIEKKQGNNFTEWVAWDRRFGRSFGEKL